MKHPQVRRARKLGEAVFRGARTNYTFEVFPLTTDIRDSAAVFIISRRIMDRFKSGHHRAICVGESDSIVRELKRHKRARCAKTFEANAVCILRENDSSVRSGVIDDLIAARSFTCIRNIVKTVAVSPTTKETGKAARSATKTIAARSLKMKSEANDQGRKTKARSIKPHTNPKPAASKARVAKNSAASKVAKVTDRLKKSRDPSTGSKRKAA